MTNSRLSQNVQGSLCGNLRRDNLRDCRVSLWYSDADSGIPHGSRSGTRRLAGGVSQEKARHQAWWPAADNRPAGLRLRCAGLQLASIPSVLGICPLDCFCDSSDTLGNSLWCLPSWTAKDILLDVYSS